MRLIGEICGSKEVYIFYSFLQGKGIECRYEPVPSERAEDKVFQFWVIDEDEVDSAKRWLEEFRKNSEDPRFAVVAAHIVDTAKGGSAPAKSRPRVLPILGAIKKYRVGRSYVPLTRFIVLICVFFFIWNGFQSNLNAKRMSDTSFTFTPLFMYCAYDLPDTFVRIADFFKRHPIETAEDFDVLPHEVKESYRKIEAAPVWRGLYDVLLRWPESERELQAPMFVKLREGQIWRLFTPCLMHGGFFHILFNMLWFWVLSRQIEERVKAWQYLSITVIIGVVSNTLQYLVSGPLFVGYSGIVCGLMGFIWMRQRCAPWERYPLQRGIIVLFASLMCGMLLLQSFSPLLSRFNIHSVVTNIANTAHIAGACTGIVLGKIPLFSKG